jgi:hypothetical protein
MNVETKPLAEVTRRAIEVLSRELGAADTLRFVNQFTTGYGDYTAERDLLFGSETLDQIIAEIKGAEAAEPPRDEPAAQPSVAKNPPD